MIDKRPIGVFDSGVGGLSILKELVRLMPKENYIFVADQINVPYGEKTKKELKKETLKICDFLVSNNSKIIVVACNTATCYALEFLRANVSPHTTKSGPKKPGGSRSFGVGAKIPIVGTVPAIKPAAASSKSGIIGVMSTPTTSRSAYLKKTIKTHAIQTKVVNVGCPKLENTVETGVLNSPEIRQLLAKYIEPIKKAGADTVVLGCTHYPFLKTQLKEALGRSIKLVDSGKAVAKHTRDVLQQMGILNGEGNRTDFFTTGDSEHFSTVASSLLKRSVKAKHVSL